MKRTIDDAARASALVLRRATLLPCSSDSNPFCFLHISSARHHVAQNHTESDNLFTRKPLPLPRSSAFPEKLDSSRSEPRLCIHAVGHSGLLQQASAQAASEHRPEGSRWHRAMSEDALIAAESLPYLGLFVVLAAICAFLYVRNASVTAVQTSRELDPAVPVICNRRRLARVGVPRPAIPFAVGREPFSLHAWFALLVCHSFPRSGVQGVPVGLPGGLLDHAVRRLAAGPVHLRAVRSPGLFAGPGEQQRWHRHSICGDCLQASIARCQLTPR